MADMEEFEVEEELKFDDDEENTKVIDASVEEVMHQSMMPYAEYVILDRALPRIEDGLKPVQRRILYSMYDMGITPDKPYKKSARIVGDCLGKYHPHGDTSVYDAMVRMAQPFVMGMTLIDGHGNFGSVDGDSAAAMRYTEARLSPLALELLKDLEKDTVKWGLNFDDTLMEPETLPGRYPNLLVNGASGIAVGLATNIPTHNLAEVIDGVVAFIDNPKITLKKLMTYIKAPDFPTGGYIVENDEIYKAYETGRGKITVKAKVNIETGAGDKKHIIISELPYQVNKAALLKKINELRETNKEVFGGIADVVDESDRHGMRAVIKVKKDVDVFKLLNKLYSKTDLQCSFNINMVAIADGKPKLLSLLEIIKYYVEYQREVIYRRTGFDLAAARERQHILTGLIIAIKNIDEVIKIIKTSESTPVARTRLRERFALSERQAQAILDMRLARLTSLEIEKLEKELVEVEKLIQTLAAIYASKHLQYETVKKEILEIKKQYKTPRKTLIITMADQAQMEESKTPKTLAYKDGYIILQPNGLIKQVSSANYTAAFRNKTSSTIDDVPLIALYTNTYHEITAFTNLGNYFKFNLDNVQEKKWKEKGVKANSIFPEIDKKEKIIAIFSSSIDFAAGYFLFFTKNGLAKKTESKEYKSNRGYAPAVVLKDNDEVIKVAYTNGNEKCLFVTRRGICLNINEEDIPVQGRKSGGVKGIALENRDGLVNVIPHSNEGEILIITSGGYAKRVVASDIEVMNRARKGVKIAELNDKSGRTVAFAELVTNPYDIAINTEKGDTYLVNSESINILNRTNQGKMVIDKRSGAVEIVLVFDAAHC